MEEVTNQTQPPASRFGVVVVSIGLVWFAIIEAMLRWQQAGVWTALGFALLIAVISTRWRTRERSRWSLPPAVLLICLSSLGAVLFTSNNLAQHLVAGLSAISLISFLDQAQHEMADELRGRLASFTLAVALWFGWMTLLSAGTFFPLDWQWVVAGGAAMTGVVGLVLWLESGIALRDFIRWLPAVVWLGGEVMLVTWWLPTSVFVGSVVAVTVLTLFLQAARHIFQHRWEPGRGRRYVVVGTSIITIVLATARWV
ncbi:MAG: hypothetical protein HY976_03835 [Candidatus Kerfeldbacteria bacterium]|nr:hypothetical protein [Candidatus Kerfeldbacteria bacterium]